MKYSIDLPGIHAGCPGNRYQAEEPGQTGQQDCSDMSTGWHSRSVFCERVTRCEIL